jgi:Family of unknown function (DUF5906)/Primase C terminal 2 (PriCT-2)
MTDDKALSSCAHNIAQVMFHYKNLLAECFLLGWEGSMSSNVVPFEGDKGTVVLFLAANDIPPRTQNVVGQWVVRDASGQGLFWVERKFYVKNHIPIKSFYHLTMSEFKVGTQYRWTNARYPKPPNGYPIMNLDLVTANRSAPVKVSEGFGCTDALGVIYPECISVTTEGGANAPHDSDLSPLAGREATLFWDDDEDNKGLEYVNFIGNYLVPFGGLINIVDMKSLGREAQLRINQNRGGNFTPQTWRTFPGMDGWDIKNALYDFGVVEYGAELPNSTLRPVNRGGITVNESALADLRATIDRLTTRYALVPGTLTGDQQQRRSRRQASINRHNVEITALPHDRWNEAKVRDALSYVEGVDDRRTRLRIGHALWSLGWGKLGLDLWCEWLERWDHFDRSKAAGRWNNFVREYRTLLDFLDKNPDENLKGRVLIGSLFWAATRAGWPRWGSEAILKEMNKQFSVVKSRNKGIVDFVGDKFHASTMITKDGFGLVFSSTSVFVEVDGEDKWLTADKAWLKWGYRNRHERAEYYAIGRVPQDHLNLFKGLAIDGSKSDQGRRFGRGWPVYRQFLLEVICNGDIRLYKYRVRLLWWKIKNPTQRTEVATVLLGVKGIGKNTFAQSLRRIFGDQYYVLISDSEKAKNKFDSLLEGRLIVVFDEAFFGHEKDLEGRLAGKITDPHLTIEPKFIDAYQVDNCAYYIFLSNKDVPVPIVHGDRRYDTSEVNNKYKGKQEYWNRAYAAIGIAPNGDDFLESAELQNFVADGLSADLDAFNRKDIPVTEAFQDIAEATEEPVYRWLRLVLEKGDLLYHPLDESNQVQFRIDADKFGRISPWYSPGGMSLLGSARHWFHKDFCQWIKDQPGKNYPLQERKFERKIKAVIGEMSFKYEQRTIGKVDTSTWFVASLIDHCRPAYAKWRKWPKTYEWGH